MKFEYINPTIRVREIQLAQMIALSKYDDPATGDDALSKSLNDFEEEDNSPKNGSFDVWED